MFLKQYVTLDIFVELFLRDESWENTSIDELITVLDEYL